jgi:hypothetical protein
LAPLAILGRNVATRSSRGSEQWLEPFLIVESFNRARMVELSAWVFEPVDDAWPREAMTQLIDDACDHSKSALIVTSWQAELALRDPTLVRPNRHAEKLGFPGLGHRRKDALEPSRYFICWAIFADWLPLSDTRKQEAHLLEGQTKLPASLRIAVAQRGLGPKSGALHADPDPRVYEREFVLIALRDRIGDLLHQAHD